MIFKLAKCEGDGLFDDKGRLWFKSLPFLYINPLLLYPASQESVHVLA